MSHKRKTKKRVQGGESSRRVFMATLGMAAAAIVGCEAWRGGPVMEVLPEAGDEGGAPVLPRELIKPINPHPVAGVDGIMPRGSWAHAGPNMSLVKPMGGVARMTFHHSGAADGFYATDAAAVAVHLERIRRYHTDPEKKDAKGNWLGRGWADIGYHYAIDPAGRVWALREVKYQGSHVLDRNANNLGVVVLGNFELQKMTAAQQQKVVAFAAVLKRQYGVPSKEVHTHREIATAKGMTDCPGRMMQAFMVDVRGRGVV